MPTNATSQAFSVLSVSIKHVQLRNGNPKYRCCENFARLCASAIAPAVYQRSCIFTRGVTGSDPGNSFANPHATEAPLRRLVPYSIQYRSPDSHFHTSPRHSDRSHGTRNACWPCSSATDASAAIAKKSKATPRRARAFAFCRFMLAIHHFRKPDMTFHSHTLRNCSCCNANQCQHAQPAQRCGHEHDDSSLPLWYRRTNHALDVAAAYSRHGDQQAPVRSGLHFVYICSNPLDWPAPSDSRIRLDGLWITRNQSRLIHILVPPSMRVDSIKGIVG